MSAACTRCGATEDGPTMPGCPECEGIVEATPERPAASGKDRRKEVSGQLRTGNSPGSYRNSSDVSQNEATAARSTCSRCSRNGGFMCDECRAAHVQESYDFAKDDDEAITNLWEAIRDMECECKGDHLRAFGLLVKEADRG